MPTFDLPDIPELPESVFEALRPMTAALAELATIPLEPMRNSVEAAARAVQQQVVDANAVIEAMQPTVLAVSSLYTDLNVAVDAMGRTAAQQVQAVLDRVDLSFDTTGLARVLQDLQALRGLDDTQWATASRVLDDAYQRAEADAAADVPDELVTGLADTARAFAASQQGFEFLTPERQRQVFAYFCGLLILLALMQASFTSEMADAVIEKTIGLSPVFILTVAAAGKAWDKHVRRPDEQAETAEERD